MSDLIAFDIYRTEFLEIKSEKYTVCFTKRRDHEEYALLATNANETKKWRCFYSPEVAADFKLSTGRALEAEVYAVLKGDIERGAI